MTPADAEAKYEAEIRAWAQNFGTTPTRLKRAIEAVGITPRKIRAYLRQLPLLK